MHKKVIICGGGTGGHVFPAIAIGQELQRQDENLEILFVGALGKLEMQKVPKAGFDIIGLWISGFHRKFTLKNLLFPVKLIWSMMHSFFIISKFQPDLIIGVGGFAAGAITKVGSWMGIKILLQEQNSYAGVTNKLTAKSADAICVAYDNMERYFPKEKIILTGNPVRKDLLSLNADREEALKHFGLEPHKKTIFIFGGSLGAKSINAAIDYGLVKNGLPQDVQMIWQVGKLYFEEFNNRRREQVIVRAFIDRMDLAYEVADVIISRAGALSVSELCLVGKPTIMVPSPNVAEDHQTKNAEAIASESGTIVIKDIDAKEHLLTTAIELLDDDERKSELAKNILRLGKPNATEDIARIALNLLEMELVAV